MWLAEALKQYGERLEKRGAKTSTLSQTKHHARVLTGYFGGATIVQKLTVGQIDSFVWYRLETVARPSVNGSLRVLRAALRSAGIEHITVRLLREERRLPEVLTELQQALLMSAARLTRPTRAAVLCALDAGLRRGEIKTLECRDFNEDTCELTVRAEVSKSRAERVIPLTSRLVDALAMRIGDCAGSTELVFTDSQVNSASSLVGESVSMLRKPGLHCLRRTFATRLHSKGAPLATVQALLGHADIQTTMRYVAALPEDAKAAIEALNEKTPAREIAEEGVKNWIEILGRLDAKAIDHLIVGKRSK